MPYHIWRVLTTFHSNPTVWWIGQLVSYIFRPTASLTEVRAPPPPPRAAVNYQWTRAPPAPQSTASGRARTYQPHPRPPPHIPVL